MGQVAVPKDQQVIELQIKDGDGVFQSSMVWAEVIDEGFITAGGGLLRIRFDDRLSLIHI